MRGKYQVIGTCSVRSGHDLTILDVKHTHDVFRRNGTLRSRCPLIDYVYTAFGLSFRFRDKSGQLRAMTCDDRVHELDEHRVWRKHVGCNGLFRFQGTQKDPDYSLGGKPVPDKLL